MRGAGAGDQVAEAGGEERPGHLREGEEEEGPAAVGVDCPCGSSLVKGGVSMDGSLRRVD